MAHFANGRISGDPSVVGDRAEVPILFGPNADRAETVVLIRRGGDFYLMSF